MDVDTLDERGRQAHVQAERARVQAKRAPPLVQPAIRGSGTRAATASFSREETAERRIQQDRAKGADARRATRTAAFRLGKDPTVYKNIATMHPDLAVDIMRMKPTRLPPLVLESPHEAAQPFHEDWTRVKDKGQEYKLRDTRNVMIAEALQDGRPVFYSSSGNSMWPLVQSGDHCQIHPIQAVTADDGVQAIPKEASEIGVGDIVFCQVQRSNQYYTRIVLMIQRDYHADEPKYWIGNVKGK